MNHLTFPPASGVSPGAGGKFFELCKRSAPSSVFFLVLVPGFIYLATLSPTINHRDSPEFVNTAFALGISHPAGFPTYNLIAKAWTFLPLGSIAFRVNLLSALVACLGLACLYVTAIRLLALLEPGEHISRFTWPALIPAGLLAFSAPFWLYSLVTEVYTLHAFFTCLIILFLLLWRQKEDLRFLFLTALVYGLSAGNHPTVALYLPAILFLFFCWNKNNAIRNLTLSIIFFLIGLSVYLYLPLRSMTEPSLDWGNPETLNGFFYQVTDQKDADRHFSFIRESGGAEMVSQEISALSTVSNLAVKSGQVAIGLLKDLNTSLLPVTVFGFLVGGYLCFRKSKPLFFFFLLVVAFNASFFAHWRRESYFPSYIVACLLTSIFIYALLFKSTEKEVIANNPAPGNIRWRKIALCTLIFLIPSLITINYYKVDRSGLYFGDTLLKRVYLSLGEKSIFIPGISWFYFYYHQDVTRLRDDVTAVKAWDLLEPNPPEFLTGKRYPDLNLPDPSRYRFDSRESARLYVLDLFRSNQLERPIYMEQNKAFLDELDLGNKFQLDRNMLLKFSETDKISTRSWTSLVLPLVQFEQLMDDEARKPGLLSDWTWTDQVLYPLLSFAKYYHDQNLFPEERRALNLMQTLGYSSPDYFYLTLDSMILEGDIDSARQALKQLQLKYPDHYWNHLGKGLLLRAEKDNEGSLLAIKKATEMNPADFRSHLELATAYRLIGNRSEEKKELQKAFELAQNLRQAKITLRFTDQIKEP